MTELSRNGTSKLSKTRPSKLFRMKSVVLLFSQSSKCNTCFKLMKRVRRRSSCEKKRHFRRSSDHLVHSSGKASSRCGYPGVRRSRQCTLQSARFTPCVSLIIFFFLSFFFLNMCKKPRCFVCRVSLLFRFGLCELVQRFNHVREKLDFIIRTQHSFLLRYFIYISDEVERSIRRGAKHVIFARDHMFISRWRGLLYILRKTRNNKIQKTVHFSVIVSHEQIEKAK